MSLISGASPNSGVDTSASICDSESNVTAQLKTREPAQVKTHVTADFHGPPKSESDKMLFDAVQAHWLWKETNRNLDVHARRVREGVEVLPAADFARFVQFSGIVKILQPHDQDGPFPCRSKELQKKCEDLIFECGEWFRLDERSNMPRNPNVPRCELEAITDILAVLVKQVARISPPLIDKTVDVGEPVEPALHVIQGGAYGVRCIE